jgi:hypothetical protein
MKFTSIVQGTWCTCAFGIAFGTPCLAQHDSRQFYEVSAGLNMEESQFSVRSGAGPTATLSLGAHLNRWFAVDGTVGGAVFGAPERITNPGGCLGAEPCVFPQPSTVKVATLSIGAEYSIAGTVNAPLLSAGVGVRTLSESPQRGNDTRPFVEIGAGVLLGRWALRARYQAASPGSDLPKWMLPMTLGYRF